MVSLGVSVLLMCIFWCLFSNDQVFWGYSINFCAIIGVFLRLSALWHISVVSALCCVLGECWRYYCRDVGGTIDGVLGGFCSLWCSFLTSLLRRSVILVSSPTGVTCIRTS